MNKLSILIVACNKSDRKLISSSIMEACDKPLIKFAENLQDALTLCSAYFFDFILLESTIAGKDDISNLKKSYLNRSYMPCIILLMNHGSRQQAEMLHPGAGGCILKKEMSAEVINRCFSSLLNMRIPGMIQQHDKQNLSGIELQLMTLAEQIKITKPPTRNTAIEDKNPPKKEKKAENKSKSPKAVPSNMVSGSLHLLIAEDNDINRFIIEKMLKNWGIKITLTSNGIETVEEFSKAKYDMVLLDIEMPGMDGYETASAIRNKLNDKKVPIIAMTGHLKQEIRDKCTKSGMNDLISKPFNDITLRQIIEKWQPSVQSFDKN